jgi:hypothetical protein
MFVALRRRKTTVPPVFWSSFIILRNISASAPPLWRADAMSTKKAPEVFWSSFAFLENIF